MKPQPHLGRQALAAANAALIARAEGQVLLAAPGPLDPSVEAALLEASAKGVGLHLLIADPDALSHPEAHQACWAQASRLAIRLGRHAQVLCARHGQRLAGPGWIWRTKDSQSERAALARRAPPFTPVQKQILQGAQRPCPVRLAACFAVSDDRSFLVATGLQENARGMTLEAADPARGLAALFAQLWAEALEAGASSPVGHPLDLLDPGAGQSNPDFRLIATLAKPGAGLWSTTPQPVLPDCRGALVRLIRATQDRLQVETEALTDPGVLEALVALGRDNPGVSLSLRLPLAPAPRPWAPSGIEAQRAATQARGLQSLSTCYRARLTLEQRPTAPEGTVILADDRRMFLGSQSLSPAGLDCDTGLGVLLAGDRVPVLTAPIAGGQKPPVEPRRGLGFSLSATLWPQALT